MKRNVLFLVAFVFGVCTYAQQERDLKLDNKNKQIEVVYYHDNGEVSQTGHYTLDGKLDGEWISYNTQGEKVAVANYDDGRKVGKWFFWNDDTLREVDYTSNTIASVNEWTRTSQIATRE
ncbi:toxin-antitoxin system YwqK family antitoxin [Mangrovimonas aestuarii]|uniref:toxin-antitoxin system YwqK family antitoxin n=1 Tax=Mangrovimonas aestuarii TaxID=3018443 RepID=UPI002377E4E8|nr:nicotinic acid mononucleotide adenyltransferase [Mangrovimonas aestuarii]